MVHALTACAVGSAASSATRAVLTATVPLRRYQHVFILDKLEYNKLHPFTSWMPILCWIVVRLRALSDVPPVLQHAIGCLA